MDDERGKDFQDAASLLLRLRTICRIFHQSCVVLPRINRSSSLCIGHRYEKYTSSYLYTYIYVRQGTFQRFMAARLPPLYPASSMIPYFVKKECHLECKRFVR